MNRSFLAPINLKAERRFRRAFVWMASLAVICVIASAASAQPAEAEDPPEPMPFDQAPMDVPPDEGEEGMLDGRDMLDNEEMPGEEEPDAFEFVVPQEASEPPLGDSEGITLDFEDASLDAVLDYLSEVAGFVVLKDAVVSGRISVVSRQPLTAAEAVDLLNTVLMNKGYAIIQTGRTLRVVLLSDAKTGNIPVRTGSDPLAVEPNDRIITQVIPLRFVDAVKLKGDLAPLISPDADLTSNASSNTLILTDTQANIRRIMEIIQALDTHLSSVADVKVFTLKYASASAAAKLINEVFKEEGTSRQSSSQQQAFRRFRGPGGEQTDTSESGARSQKIIAAADDDTNILVVSGPPDILKVVEGVVAELDNNPTAEQAVFTYQVKNATAANLVDVLNELFEEQSSSSTSQAQSGRNRFRPPGFGGNTQSSTTTSSGTDLAGEVHVVADEDSNSLMVMTAAKNFERVREIIEELDKPVQQVLIKVLIAEVTHSNNVDLGMEFSALNLRASDLGQTGLTDFNVAAANDGLIVNVLEEDFTAALRVLQTVGKLDVLSRPYILASDNQEASINIGQRVPFISESRTTETSQTINTVEYEDIGIKLSVTPHINPEGLVIMDVSPEIINLTGESVTVSETLSLPVYTNRSATSRVAIQDGQTIVIGGMMEDMKTDVIRKVPLLGDIPLLGALFRRTVKETSKTELLIFLTPHVAEEALALQSISDGEMEDLEIVPHAVDEGIFERHMEGMKRRGPTTAPQP